MGSARGVEVRENSIRIRITHKGQAVKGTLTSNGEPLTPTPANLKYAARVAEDIRQKLKFGTFRRADYFPDDGTDATPSPTLGDKLSSWLKLQTNLKSSTIKSYRVSIDWWTRHLGDKPIGAIVHSDILDALSKEPTWSGKTRNNRVIPLRRTLELAIRDRVIQSNPLDGLEAASHQKPEPDPFTQEEAEAIIRQVEKTYGEAMANYFGFKFFTGLRTGESLGLRWGSIDWPSKTMLVKEGLVMGEHVASTKTSKTRTVRLNSSALHFLRRQKAHTFMLPDGWVFVDPQTNQRWVDDWGPRNTYWEPTLRKLGMRYRSPYQTRHTYATMMLMAGVAPAFAAKQMGHSIQMFLSTYARWIDGQANDLEMDKLEGLLGRAETKKSASA